ncbi:MAG: methyltransferase domain-containing protein [Arenicellales bacterium]
MATEVILSRTYSPRAMKERYARVAWFYDSWGRLTEDQALRRLLDLAEVEDGCQALEVAVGTGRLFARLVTRNSSGRNEGIDLSPDMLAHARRRLDSLVEGESARLQEGTAYDLPFESGTFDILFNAFMLDMLPVEDFPRVLGELKRVLKPGGKLALAYFSYGQTAGNRFWAWIARRFPSLLTQCRPIRLETPLREAGFEVLHQEEVSQNTFPSAIVIARKLAQD